MPNPIKKGKRGEREFSHFLKDIGYNARRRQQHAGAAAANAEDENPEDLIHDVEGVHIEVKKGYNANIGGRPISACSYSAEILSWIDQAKGDMQRGGKTVWCVAWRPDYQPWYLIYEDTTPDGENIVVLTPNIAPALRLLESRVNS